MSTFWHWVWNVAAVIGLLVIAVFAGAFGWNTWLHWRNRHRRRSYTLLQQAVGDVSGREEGRH